MSSFNKVFVTIEAVVARQSAGLSFAEVQAATRLPKASTHRILKGLVALGYLNFDQETKKYRGSLKLASFGAEVMANFDLRSHIHPQLITLHNETGHTCNMGLMNGEIGVFADKIQSQDYGIKLFSEVGKTFPLHCTGLGKVLLSYSPADVLDRILSRPLQAITDKTITRPEELRKQFATIRKKGYAIDMEEITRGIMCVAAPVFGVKDEIICAVSITFPTFIHKERGIAKEIKAITHHASIMSGSFK
jgi:DNA-binding IclR family transcriptional regulator